MPACPDDRTELKVGALGPGCPACGGVWLGLDELHRVAAGATQALLSPETEPHAPPFKQPRRCPQCEAVLAPWRIGGMAAWADRCPTCEAVWLEKGDLRTLTLVAKQLAVKRAYGTFSVQEREQIARDLAADSTPPEGYPLSPFHAFLAVLGLPVIRRTQGSRTPWATWSLALLLIASFVLGGSEAPEAWGYHPGSSGLLGAVSANFVHFGLAHLLGNLYFLFAFGDGVEQRLPRPAVLALFVLAGTAALAFDGAVSPVETIAGASGGIAALMGACVVLQPRARVMVFLFRSALPVPLALYVGFELLYQLAMAGMGVPGTAWLAHIAGIVLGVMVGALVKAGDLELKIEMG